MPGHSEIVPTAPTIIVVEDDKAVRNSLKFSLQIEGFVVRVYAAALELLADPFVVTTGCLVIDYRLPEMNGLDLLAELRRRKVTLPAILITTHPSDALRAHATAAGIALVEKPLLDGSLLQAIQSVLPGVYPISPGARS
jgi:FixJ family two-component response regulator